MRWWWGSEQSVVHLGTYADCFNYSQAGSEST
jgi:hypothetical protein